MARTRKKRRHDLSALARQANHVVAAAVFVFVASILLGSVLAPWLTVAAAWVRRAWGDTGALLVGPLLLDGLKVLLLLAVAFPFGRVTAPRPWVSGTALVLLVYGFWLSFDFVVGELGVLYGQWRPLVGRGLLLALTIYGVARLMRRGRRAALEADIGERPGGDAPGEAKDADPPPEEQDEDKSSETKEDPESQADDDENNHDAVCKQAARAGVSGGVR